MFRKFASRILVFFFLLALSFSRVTVISVQAQTPESGLCSQYMPSQADVMSCIDEFYGPGSVQDLCTPELCQCDNWAEAMTFETVNSNRSCENDFCGFYADSGSSHLGICFPLTVEAGEATRVACAVEFDTSNNRAAVVSNYTLAEGSYSVRFSGKEMSGDQETLSTTTIAIDEAGTTSSVTIPEIPERFSFAYAEILDSNGDVLCQNGMTGDQLGLLQTTVTDEEIEEAADPEGNPGEANTSSGTNPGTRFSYCNQVPDGPQRQECNTCLTGAFDDKGNQTKIFTAVGCVNVSGKDLAADLIKLMLGIGGGVALLSILNAAFKLTISRGDSSKVKEAKELVTASVTGLLFIIFSVIIMEFVGVEILHIPGLG